VVSAVGSRLEPLFLAVLALLLAKLGSLERLHHHQVGLHVGHRFAVSFCLGFDGFDVCFQGVEAIFHLHGPGRRQTIDLRVNGFDLRVNGFDLRVNGFDLLNDLRVTLLHLLLELVKLRGAVGGGGDEGGVVGGGGDEGGVVGGGGDEGGVVGGGGSLELLDPLHRDRKDPDEEGDDDTDHDTHDELLSLTFARFKG